MYLHMAVRRPRDQRRRHAAVGATPAIATSLKRRLRVADRCPGTEQRDSRRHEALPRLHRPSRCHDRHRPHRRRRSRPAPPARRDAASASAIERDGRRERRGGRRACSAAPRRAHRRRRARPRDARPRRHGRARPRCASAASTCPVIVQTAQRLDRDGDLGDARRRRRFRGQAGRRRAPAGLDQERAQARRARRTRCAACKRRAAGTLAFRDLVTKSADMARVDPPRRARREVQHPDPDRGRIRRRQGGARPRHPGLQRPRAASPSSRSTAARSPRTSSRSILFGHEKGAFTGATEQHLGKFVGGRWRHAVPRRDRRAAARRAGQAAARAAGGRGRPGRRASSPVRGRHPPHLGDQPEPARAGRSRASSARTSTTASTSSRSRCRRCAQRREDIADLARALPRPLRRRGGQAARAASPPRRWRCSARYDWPGNVRQLENAMFRAVVLADGDELTVAEFPQIAAQMEGFDVRIPPAPAADRTRRAARRAAARSSRCRCAIPMRSSSSTGSDMRKLDELEREIITLRAGALPRPHVRGLAQARHRPLDALPQAQGLRADRRANLPRRNRRGLSRDDPNAAAVAPPHLVVNQPSHAGMAEFGRYQGKRPCVVATGRNLTSAYTALRS